MFRTFGRRLLWAYALLTLLAAYGYARFDGYMMDGDGTAFMDIAQALNTHHAGLAINAYWNPGYPAVLALAERLTRPTLWHELAVVRMANVVVFACAMGACFLFTSALVRARRLRGGAETAGLSDTAVHLLGLGLLILSLGRELPVAAPRADTLLFLLLLISAALVLHLLIPERRFWLFPILGAVLGCAYLTKSFAFLPSAALLVGLLAYGGTLRGAERRTMWLGSLVCGLVFACIAGPYILAISRQLGHFSTGESARLNYAFFVDLTGRWHEWYHHDLGHAGGAFLHPEQVLATNPPVYSYAAHPVGTFPLWFDPAWWTLGIKPHVWLKGHVLRLARNLVVFCRYLLGRPEPFVLLGVLLACGAAWPRLRPRYPAGSWKQQAWWLVPVFWGVLMLGIYFPVDLQDRYLTAPLFLVLLPLFAALEARPGSDTATSSVKSPAIANALVLLFAGMVLSQAGTYLADRRRHTPLPEQAHSGYDPQIFTAAAALDKLGLQPGDKVACMGDLACYTDFYWARLAGTQILAEVETPDEANPVAVWSQAPDKQAITAPLAAMGLRYVVSLFPNSAQKPQGWIQLGGSNFFAYPLQQPVSARQAANLAEFRPTP